MFGRFGLEFQWLSTKAQGFHGEFVNLIKPGAGAYAGAEVADAELAAVTAVDAPGGAAAASAVSAAGPGGSLAGWVCLAVS